jgi:hypothetical protein
VIVSLLATLALTGAPASSLQQEDELRFAVLGHIRGSFDGEPHFLLDELVEQVAAQEPDLVFLTGDLVFGQLLSTEVERETVLADWEALDRAFARTGAEVHRTPGNHDISEPVTRDLWIERYGPFGSSFRRGRTLFVLLNTTPVPEDHVPVTVPRTREKPTALPDDQLALLRTALGDGSEHDRAFVFVHHTLWWHEDGPWWRDVHPVLAAGKVRAVFGGDLNPLKFSHVRREGIDYVQSALTREGPPIARLHEAELVRLRQAQLDAFPFVTIRGDEIEIDVLTVGALSSGRLTPALHQEVLLRGPEPPAEPEPVEFGTASALAKLLWTLLATALGLVLGLALGRQTATRRRAS